MIDTQIPTPPDMPQEGVDFHADFRRKSFAAWAWLKEFANAAIEIIPKFNEDVNAVNQSVATATELAQQATDAADRIESYVVPDGSTYSPDEIDAKVDAVDGKIPLFKKWDIIVDDDVRAGDEVYGKLLTLNPDVAYKMGEGVIRVTIIGVADDYIDTCTVDVIVMNSPNSDDATIQPYGTAFVKSDYIDDTDNMTVNSVVADYYATNDDGVSIFALVLSTYYVEGMELSIKIETPYIDDITIEDAYRCRVDYTFDNEYQNFITPKLTQYVQ